MITEPAVEPVTIAEVMAWGRLDSDNQEPAPSALTAALAGLGAGNVDNGAHRYLATFVTADGETQAGTISDAVTTTGGDGQVALTSIPLGGGLVTSRKIYRTQAGGSDYFLLATIADNTTTTYADNIADGSLGAGAPSANTTTDPTLNMLITAARKVAEKITGRSLITQTLEQVFDKFDPDGMALDTMPVQSITSVKYIDEDGVEQTTSSADYVLDNDTIPSWLLRAYDVDWSDTRDVAQAVVIRFVAGYGAAGSDVPAEIRMWIAAQVAAAYDNPDGLLRGNPSKLKFMDHLLDPYEIRML